MRVAVGELFDRLAHADHHEALSIGLGRRFADRVDLDLTGHLGLESEIGCSGDFGFFGLLWCFWLLGHSGCHDVFSLILGYGRGYARSASSWLINVLRFFPACSAASTSSN